MQLRQLRYLIAVAEHGNFTRAAQALHVSQPALSQQILQIEDRLGVALLDRSGRSVTVTDAGQVYIDHARRALHELEAARRAVHDVRDLSRGQVRLAMTPTFTAYLAGPLVAAFHERHPGIRVLLREMAMDTIAEAVAADAVDLGIAFAPARATEVECTPLFMETLGVVVARGHPWARRRAVEAAELGDACLALLGSDFVTRTHIDDYLQRHGLAPKVAVEANTISALIEIVRHSALATILPEAVSARDPELRKLSLRPDPPSREAMLMRRREGYLSAAARAFADLLTQQAPAWGAPPETDAAH